MVCGGRECYKPRRPCVRMPDRGFPKITKRLSMIRAFEPTRKYFFTIFLLSCALLMVFTLVIYRQFKITEQRNYDVAHTYEVIRQIKDTLIHTIDAQASQRGYLLTSRGDYLVAYNDAVYRLNKQLSDLEVSVSDNPRQRAAVESMKTSIRELLTQLQSRIRIYERGGYAALRANNIDTKAPFDRMRDMVSEVTNEEYRLLGLRWDASQRQQQEYRYTLFIGAALSLGAMVVANMIIYMLLARTRRSEQALRASEERSMLVINGVSDGIYDLNLLDNSIYYSPSYKAMLGYSDEEHPNTLEQFNTLLHPEDKEKTWDVVNRYLAGETPRYVNYFRLRHRDGSWRWIMSRGIGIRDETGKIVRLVGAHTDVTEHKRREQELEMLNNDLESFTYIASHDLRAPLINLKGFSSEIRHALNDINPILEKMKPALSDAERARLERNLGRDVPESLQFINSAVERMDKLTTAIVEVSRIGKREYRNLPVDCTEVLKRCIHTLAHEISQKNITVEYRNLPVIQTDPLAIEQIFGNLLDNAVKYLDPARPGHIVINAHYYLNEVVFSVTDNGRGIAETDYRKVFEVFRRAANSGDVRGSGMGMPYVTSTLRKLGGRIWLDSRLNEGTTFYFSLPATPGAQEAA